MTLDAIASALPDAASAGPDPDLRTRRTRAADRVRRLTGGRPHLLVVAANLGVLTLAWIFSYLVRFEFGIPEEFGSFMLLALPFVVAVKCVALYAGGVFRIIWAYVGLRDLATILRATLGASIALYAVNVGLLPEGIVPRGVVVLDGLLTFVGVSALYAVLRSLREGGHGRRAGGEGAERILIVGAGDTGEALLRELERRRPEPARVVGFVDDAPEMQGRLLRGVPVVGRLSEIRALARKLRVRTAYVAITTAGGDVFRRVARPLLEEGIVVRALPPIGQLSSAAGFLPQLREVAIEDLLRRAPVRLETERISAFIRGKSVLVTGASGSIGSELCRQILAYRPARLAALDCAETPLHDLMLEVPQGAAERVVFPELGDVTDPGRLRAVFSAHRPQVIFHAAALKHVPICESNPREAIRVNVGGTRNVAEAALLYGSEHFVMISTDKAVNPSSVMGAAKRVAELLVQHIGAGANTRFASVRFGNVLGSNGSVLRIFKSQLARGGPLTVTHPEMRRYFMTIPEAVQLVLQAAVMGRGGEVFELDMGQPVRIVDLAEDFVRLSGLVPGRDVQITFTGIRPGEKLFEELYLDTDLIEPTSHPKVFCLKEGRRFGPDPALSLCLDRLGAVDPEADPVLAGLKEDLSRMFEAFAVREADP